MQLIKLADLRPSDASARRFPAGDYIAFAIGSDSEHDVVDIDVPGVGPVRLGVGAPALVPSTRGGTPVIIPVRYGVAAATVIGYECGDELAFAAARAAYARRNVDISSAAEGDATVLVPFSGRKKLAVTINSTHLGAVTYTLTGRVYYGATSYDSYVIEAATALTTATTIVQYEGSEGNGEAFDIVDVTVGGDAIAATRLHIEAV